MQRERFLPLSALAAHTTAVTVSRLRKLPGQKERETEDRRAGIYPLPISDASRRENLN